MRSAAPGGKLLPIQNGLNGSYGGCGFKRRR
jgi:hypothetical protein